MHTYMLTHIHTHTHTHIHTYIHTCIHTWWGKSSIRTSDSLREASAERSSEVDCASSSFTLLASGTGPLTFEKEEMRRDFAISNRSEWGLVGRGKHEMLFVPNIGITSEQDLVSSPSEVHLPTIFRNFSNDSANTRGVAFASSIATPIFLY